MRRTPLLLTAALTAVLAGCASTGGLHSDAKTLQADQLAASRSLGHADVSHDWPATDWWTALGDKQLDGLIDEALKNNPDLAIARARARAAEAQAGAAEAATKPTLNAGASVAGARLPSTLVPAPIGGHFSWIKYGYLSFNWDIDLWGGERAAWEAAVGRARAAAIDTQTARLELSANVARAYAQFGYACRQQDLAREQLARATHVRKLTDQRVQAGIDSRLQLQQSTAEQATTEQQLAAADRRVTSARNALSVLLGKGPDRGLDIARPQPLSPASVALPSTLPAQLLGRRPDVIAAKLRVEAASKDIQSAKTRFLPNLSLGALAGLAAGGGDNLFQLPARFYQVAPAVSLPIFEGGRLRANLAGRDAARDLAVAQYNKTLIGALDAIADKLDGVKALKQQAAAQQRALDAAREAWKLAMDRYKSGIGSYLQALTVQRQLLAAEQSAAALHAEQVDLSVQLIEALGGGYRPADDPSNVSPTATAANTDSSRGTP
ncbi:efflux transporter outer membrane subunit [Oleiagrimonas citrea]|uniref:Efflux transporter outer membrane subunit n=1 Tax=Oleiagrimonas citrea TaxID=1665687 RepID=A0A846ZQM5_9GAMM|nr:efflux transporter outer membrane subunit [Oleiagrimonas citrea]NKZ39880.1 efflux transporter outer membrane subunit [Oleiagrimonas citrea]